MRNYCDNPAVNKAIDEAIDQNFGINGTWNDLDKDEILNDCVFDFLFSVLENLNIECDDDEFF